MNGRFNPQTLNPHVFSNTIIDQSNMPYYGTEGEIVPLTAGYRTRIGNLVIIGFAFQTTVALPAFTALMYFNTYTGTPLSGFVNGMLTDQNGAGASLYYENGNVLSYSAMPIGNWRGFIVFTVDA